MNEKIHHYLLALVRLAPLALLATGTANATEYNLCNKGTIEVRFATALRSGNSLFGYSWHLNGWYAIPPGKCEDAYLHKSHRDPDEPIYVALAFRDSTGVWGAATFDKPKVDTKLCVGMDYFEYQLNGNINLPCRSGYYPFPAALYFEPTKWQCYSLGPNWPANCSGGNDRFSFSIDHSSRAIAAGPPSARHSTQTNAEKSSTEKQDSDGLSGTVAPRPDAPTPGRSQWRLLGEALEAARVQTQRESARAYIVAAGTGFESYKQGAPQVNRFGVRFWSAKEISLPADSCIVTESATNLTLRCLAFTSSSRVEIEARYAELLKSVAAALPENWEPYSRPDLSKMFNENVKVLAGTIFGSSSGLQYYIWTLYYDSQYELGYQVLAPRRPGEGTRSAAPSKPAPAPAPDRSMTPHDDPIGEGGFITPYVLPKK